MLLCVLKLLLTLETSALFLVHSQERNRGAQPIPWSLDRAVAPSAAQASPLWVRCQLPAQAATWGVKVIGTGAAQS